MRSTAAEVERSNVTVYAMHECSRIDWNRPFAYHGSGVFIVLAGGFALRTSHTIKDCSVMMHHALTCCWASAQLCSHAPKLSSMV